MLLKPPKLGKRHQETIFLSSAEAHNVRYRKPLCEVSAGAKSNGSIEPSRIPAPARISFSRFSHPPKNPLSFGGDGQSRAIELSCQSVLCPRDWHA